MMDSITQVYKKIRNNSCSCKVRYEIYHLPKYVSRLLMRDQSMVTVALFQKDIVQIGMMKI
jgi:hypothetical protein